jgi:hypothetical protein
MIVAALERHIRDSKSAGHQVPRARPGDLFAPTTYQESAYNQGWHPSPTTYMMATVRLPTRPKIPQARISRAFCSLVTVHHQAACHTFDWDFPLVGCFTS